MQKIRPDMDIGHNIQRLRRNANMTQEQLLLTYSLWELKSPKALTPNWKLTG